MKKFSTFFAMLLVTIFLLVFTNVSFYQHVVQVYPLDKENFLFVCSLFVVLGSVMMILFSLLNSKYTLKPLLMLFLLLASLTNYFMITYNIVIDSEMIRNSLQTDFKESFDLLNIKMILYVFILGVLPSIFVYKMPIEYKGFKSELFSKLKIIGSSVLLVVLVIFSLSKFYTSFFREHKPLRYYTNPTYPLYSAGKYMASHFATKIPFEQIGLDAAINVQNQKKKLVIFVVGESARADRFSLNGYEKQTNPLLAKEDMITFSQFYSCGTSTATSVPCMFSHYTRSEFNYEKTINTENVIDLLDRTQKVSLLWRDNNSDSKGVAVRIPYEDFKRKECGGECRDESLLVDLQEYIDAQKNKDIFIVLHQMGNHGPAYYKRYPKEFEKFKPICQSNQLEQCSAEEINNAYDNVILYTDYFLAKTIALLKENQNDFSTAMIYVSDHGESLGENGVYLHAMPYFIAPDAQKHVGALMWFGTGEMGGRINEDALRSKALGNTYSQDNLFHTVLGLMQVETKVYDPNMDILR